MPYILTYIFLQIIYESRRYGLFLFIVQSTDPNLISLTCVFMLSDPGVVVRYENGLPVFTMPLPSRREICQFTLKPITDTVGDFLKFIHEEDKGVDRVAIYNSGEKHNLN